MWTTTRTMALLLTLLPALAGCDGATSSTPSDGRHRALQPPAPPAADPGRVQRARDGIRDVRPPRRCSDQIVQVNTANELIWTADGTRLPGYRIGGGYRLEAQHQFIEGKICADGCAFEVRFGTEDGERRAYLTVDYGHDNPGTVVDVEVAGGELLVTQTDVYPPGSPTLSGVVMGTAGTGATGRRRRGARHFIRLAQHPNRPQRLLRNTRTD